MEYELLEHAGDLKIKVYGNSFSELLENSGRALSDIVLPDSGDMNETRKIFIEGSTKEQILVRFLNELIYLIQSDFLIFRKFKIEDVDNGVNALCMGSKIKSSDQPDYDMKGATYHELKIENNDGKYTAQIVIDI